MALTDLEAKKANATGKPQKRADGSGLNIVLMTSAKRWRLAYILM